jgi:hypothetical protein
MSGYKTQVLRKPYGFQRLATQSLRIFAKSFQDAQLALTGCVECLNRAQSPLFDTRLASLGQLKRHSHQIYGSEP